MDENVKSQVNDDELNRMIANLKGQQASNDPTTSIPSVQDDSTQSDSAVPTVNPAPESDPIPMPNPIMPASASPVQISPVDDPTPPAVNDDQFTATPIGTNLDDLKRDAVSELRPLVDKLDLPPEDRFNTLLLIIRSTDDSSLLSTAHEAAKQISDDTRRAQALLDIIKEVDFFKQQH